MAITGCGRWRAIYIQISEEPAARAAGESQLVKLFWRDTVIFLESTLAMRRAG
jgi:hypothetical protein